MTKYFSEKFINLMIFYLCNSFHDNV